MRIRDHPDTATAFVLLAIAVLAAAWRPPLPGTTAPRSLLPPEGSSARVKFEWCRENVSIVHDLYWASACSRVAAEQDEDDSPECTLPDDRAGPLNAARARAEQQCLDEATAWGP